MILKVVLFRSYDHRLGFRYAVRIVGTQDKIIKQTMTELVHEFKIFMDEFCKKPGNSGIIKAVTFSDLDEEEIGKPASFSALLAMDSGTITRYVISYVRNFTDGEKVEFCSLLNVI